MLTTMTKQPLLGSLRTALSASDLVFKRALVPKFCDSWFKCSLASETLRVVGYPQGPRTQIVGFYLLPKYYKLNGIWDLKP